MFSLWQSSKITDRSIAIGLDTMPYCSLQYTEHLNRLQSEFKRVEKKRPLAEIIALLRSCKMTEEGDDWSANYAAGAGRGEDAASDADTDDLIVSGIELLSQEASLLTNQRPPEFFSVSGHTASDPMTPESQQLPSGASASYLSRLTHSNSARRSLFGGVSPATKIGDPSDQAPRSCLKPLNSPSKAAAANLSVSFSVEMPRLPESHDGSHHENDVVTSGAINEDSSSHLEPIVARHVKKLETVFGAIREDFGHLSRLSELSSEAESRSFALPLKGQDKAAEDAFLKTLTTGDLRQLLEAETMKRLHCERKIEMLSRRCLQLEERLSIAETHVGTQRLCLDQVEADVKALTDDFCDREQQRLAICQTLLNENVKLKESAAVSSAHTHLLNRRLEDAETQLQAISQVLSTERRETQSLRLQCDSLTQNFEQARRLVDEKSARIDRLEADLREAKSRETDLSVEYNAKDDELRRTLEVNRRLTTELAAEKSAGRQRLEQKEQEDLQKTKELEKNAERKLMTTTDQLKKTHEKELMGAKSACELALRSSAAQTDMLRRERDHLAAKLDQLERDLDLTHQQMASELQAKLAAKYHELLAEFGYHHAGLYAGGVSNQGGAAGASAWSQHDNYGTSTFTGNLAQEFLSDLGHTFPIVTPRSTDEHGAGYGSNLDQASGRRSHLQGVLKQVLPPRDQRRQGHSSHQGHPTDPDK